MTAREDEKEDEEDNEEVSRWKTKAGLLEVELCALRAREREFYLQRELIECLETRVKNCLPVHLFGPKHGALVSIFSLWAFAPCNLTS